MQLFRYFNLYKISYSNALIWQILSHLLLLLGDCQPIGLIDVTDCYYGFPISLSFPHFMNGDVGLVENVTGMEPDPAKHSTAFVIQPVSNLGCLCTSQKNTLMLLPLLLLLISH